MANIAAVVVKMLVDTTGVVRGAMATAQTMNRVTQAVLPAENAMQRTASVGDRLTMTFQRLNGEATGYLKAMLGIGAGSAMVAKALKMFSEAQDSQRQASGDQSVVTLSDSWNRLGTAVDKAFEAFGRGLNSTGNLNKTMALLISAVEQGTPIIEAFGAMAGRVWNFMLNYPPILLMVVTAVKILGVVMLWYVHHVVASWIVGHLTLLILGQKMTIMQLLWASRSLIAAAATHAWTGAVWLLNAAMTVAMMVGLPMWAGIAAVIGVVVAISYALLQVWNWLTGAIVKITPAPIESVTEATKKAVEETERLRTSLSEALRNFGKSDAQLEMEKFEAGLNRISDSSILFGADQEEMANVTSDLAMLYGMMVDPMDHMAEAAEMIRASRAAEFETDQAKLAALQQEAKLRDQLLDIAKEYNQAGMTDIEKRLAGLRVLGANDNQLEVARAVLTATEAHNAQVQQRQQLVSSIADLEKQAAQAGMTAMEKRLADARALGAQESDILRIMDAQAKIDEAKRREEVLAADKQLGDNLKNQGQQLADSLATPLEVLQKKLEDIQRLRMVGALNDDFANRAIDAAEAEFNKSQQGPGGRTRQADSPQALLRGSYDAALAENRAKTNAEVQTELARVGNKIAADQLTETRNVVTQLKNQESVEVTF